MDATLIELQKKVGSCFAESMTSVFSMLTGRDFTITPKDGQLIETDGVAGLHSGTTVFVKANYTKGLTGTLFFSLSLKEGTILVDLMLGGEGSPAEELEGDSRDALAETFNQVMGSANQTLSDMAGETLSISNVEIFAHPASDTGAVGELFGKGAILDMPMNTVQDALDSTIHVLLPDLLLQQVKRKLGLGEPSVPAAAAAPPAPAAPAAAPQAPSPLSPPSAVSAALASASAAFNAPSVDTKNLDLLLDIELPLVVRMGQTEMPLGDLLKITPGAILELNRAADAPVELLVNNKMIARGEVVVVDGNFAFRITEIESTANRIRSLA